VKHCAGARLGSGPELSIDDVVRCQVLHDLRRDPGDGGVICCHAVDEVEQLETLGQRPLACARREFIMQCADG